MSKSNRIVCASIGYIRNGQIVIKYLQRGNIVPLPPNPVLTPYTLFSSSTVLTTRLRDFSNRSLISDLLLSIKGTTCRAVATIATIDRDFPSTVMD